MAASQVSILSWVTGSICFASCNLWIYNLEPSILYFCCSFLARLSFTTSWFLLFSPYGSQGQLLKYFCPLSQGLLCILSIQAPKGMKNSYRELVTLSY